MPRAVTPTQPQSAPRLNQLALVYVQVLDALRLCGPRESFRTQRTDTSKSGDELSFLVDPSSAGRHRLAFSQLPFVWRPHGTDNALVADAKDVIEEMASLTNRTLRWPKSHRHTLAVTRQKKVSRSKLIYKIQDDIATCRGRGQGSTSRSRPSELNSALDGSMTSLSGGSSLTNTTRPPSRSSWLPRLDAFRAQGAGYTSRSRGERSFGLFVSFDHKLTPLAEKLAASVAPMVMRNGPVHVASIDNPVAYASSESGSSTAIGATDQGGSSQRLVRLTTAKHALWMGADMPALLRLALAARIEYGVGKSHGLILLQTSAVLHHPITLLEVFKAIMNEIPIVCVKVHGAGYSFARAQRYLAELTETDAGKYPAAHAAVCEWLRERGIKFGTFKWVENHTASDLPLRCRSPTNLTYRHGARRYALFSTIPSIISIALDPKRSDNHWHAVALDVVEKRNITSEHNQVKDRSSDRDSSNRSRFESRDPSCRDSSLKDSRARPTPITPEPSCNSTMRSRVTLRRQSTTSCSTTDATASLSTTTTWKRVQRMDQMASVARNAGVLNESGDDEVGLMSLIAVQGRVRGFLARIDSRSSTSRRSSVRRDSTWTPHLTESSAPGRTDMGRRSDFSEGSHISTVNRRKSAGDKSRSKLIGMHISRESTPRDRSRSAPGDRASSSSRRESTGSASSVERALQAHLVTEMELERCSSSGSGQEGNYTARSKRKAVALREVVVDR